MTIEQEQAARELVDSILPELEAMPVDRKIRTLKAVGELLPGRDGDSAANAAAALERAQEKQLELRTIVKGGAL